MFHRSITPALLSTRQTVVGETATLSTKWRRRMATFCSVVNLRAGLRGIDFPGGRVS